MFFGGGLGGATGGGAERRRRRSEGTVSAQRGEERRRGKSGERRGAFFCEGKGQAEERAGREAEKSMRHHVVDAHAAIRCGQLLAPVGDDQ